MGMGMDVMVLLKEFRETVDISVGRRAKHINDFLELIVAMPHLRAKHVLLLLLPNARPRHVVPYHVRSVM